MRFTAYRAWQDVVSDTLAKGTVIGKKYVIDRVIGSGGMGTVYEALQQDVNRRVAVKVLKKIDDSSGLLDARFQREARAAGRIGHDNVLEVTDFGIDADGPAFLVMPLLEGCSLGGLIEKEGPLPLKRIVDIALQTLSALEAAHDKGIVHRDLKPDNIFITKVGDREDFVKLLDFGISKYLGSDAATKFTRTGLVPGTPLYMAPEQASGDKALDHRIDLYSLGVILYEAFTGELPFKGDSYNEILIKIVSKPFKNPRMIKPDIPLELEKIITKAMARSPKLRFKGAREMREALEEIVTHELLVNTGEMKDLGSPSRKGKEDAPCAIEPFLSADEGEEKSFQLEKKPKWKRTLLYSVMIVALVQLLVALFGLIGYFFFGSG